MSLRVLIVDSNRPLAETIVRVLAKAGLASRTHRVYSRAKYENALCDPYDVIVSNFSMLRFDALEALTLRDARAPGTPLVVVTEAGGEEVAVDCMKHGAADFVRFDQLERLPDAIRRAVGSPAPARAKPTAGAVPPPSASRAEVEVLFRFRLEPHLRCDYVSPAILVLTGHAPAELYADPHLFLRLAADEDLERCRALLDATCEGAPQTLEWIRSDGTSRWVEVRTESSGGASRAVHGHARDVTEIARVEDEARRHEALLNAVRGLAERFGRTPSWNEELPAFLDRLGRASRATRGTVTANGEGGCPPKTLATWTRARTDGPDEALPADDREMLGSWRALLERGAIVAGPAHLFDPLERAALSARSIRTIVLAPIFVSGAWWGTLRLEDTKRTRDWSAAETNAVRTAVDLLGSAIERAGRPSQPARFLRPASASPGLRALEAGRDPHDVGAWESMADDPELRKTIFGMLERAGPAIGCGAMVVLIADDRSQVLHPVAVRGLEDERRFRSPIWLGHDLPGRLAKDRCRLHVSSLETVAGTSPRARAYLDAGYRSYHAVPLVGGGALRGVMEILFDQPRPPDDEWVGLVEARAARLVLAIEKAELLETLNQSNVEIQLAYDSTLEGWTRALDLRDRETEGHTRRVTEMTLALAEAMGELSIDFVHLRRGALLHDIGKMGIPDRILHKAGPLDASEWQTMKLHPVYAHEMLSPIEYLRPAVEIPYGHHERWDGSGYPLGLRGETIPLAARIFAVADVWDALRSDRPYRKSWPEDRTRQYIEENAGSHFDPRVVHAFIGSEVYRMPMYGSA